MSEAKAQALLLKEGYLAEIGDYYDVININDYPIAEQMLMYYGKLFNDAVQKNLDKSGSIATGKIGDLVVPKVNKFGNDYEMWLGYDKVNPASVYYKFVNKGVRGVANTGKKKIGDTPYSYKSPYPSTKMINSLEEWYKLGKAKSSSNTQKKALSKTARKNKKLASMTKKMSLKELATATAFAIKRDGLKSTYFFDNAIKQIFDKQFFQTMAQAFGGDVQLQIRQFGNKIEKDGDNNK